MRPNFPVIVRPLPKRIAKSYDAIPLKTRVTEVEAVDEGMTKLIFDQDTERVLGVGIVGPNAGDLIAEA